MRRTIGSTEQSERRPLTARNSEIDTKTRLLDAAERLFSDRGFEAVSHRDIAVAAAVNLAAVNYHFGSKDRFIRAVIKRRVDSINARRLAALARAERQEGTRQFRLIRSLRHSLALPSRTPMETFKSFFG